MDFTKGEKIKKQRKTNNNRLFKRFGDLRLIKNIVFDGYLYGRRSTKMSNGNFIISTRNSSVIKLKSYT